MERRHVIVVGGGPAGSATALGLARDAPEVARGTLVLEKARHPRDKTCAGGVIPRAEALLSALGLPLAVPSASVDAAAVAVPGARIDVAGAGFCRVVRRRELDAMLAGAVVARGVEMRCGVHVHDLVRDGRGVRVETDAGVFWAPVVVGADGSGSLVRRRLVAGPAGEVARAVMCDVPLAEARWRGFEERRYEFDFTGLARGMRGYGWVFPCLVDGAAHANVGVYALPPWHAGDMRRELGWLVRGIGGREPAAWKAFPIQTFHPRAALAAGDALLVGDAAGVDPLMGEGISFAIEYGLLAAATLARRPPGAAADAAAYEEAVRRGPIGRKLARLAWATERCYGPRWRWWFRAARTSRRLQRASLDWYNGTAGWNGRGRLALLRALAQPGRRAA